MFESTIINQWVDVGRADGMVKERRDALLDVLDERFPNTLGPERRATILYEVDLALLRRWFRAALRASSAEEFHDALRQ